MSSPESQEIWTKSAAYHNSFLIPKDEILDKIVENSKANGLRDIAVTAGQGKFLYLLALSVGAKKVLEVGTLGGWASNPLDPVSERVSSSGLLTCL